VASFQSTLPCRLANTAKQTQYPIPVLKALVNTISTCGNTQTAKQAVAAWLENATMRNQHSSPEVQLAKELVDELQKDSPYGSQQALILCALLDLNDSSFTRTSQRVGKSHKVAYFTFVRDTAKHLFEVSFDEFRYVNMTFLGQGGLKVVEKGNPVHPERRNEEAVVIWDLEYV
jgi:hypothetical protein